MDNLTINDVDIHPATFSGMWCATLHGYEGGDPIGYGWTREAAFEDLLDEMSESARGAA